MINRRDTLGVLFGGGLAGLGGALLPPQVRLQEDPGGVFDVRSFGARGDGEAADGPAIQAAIDAASSAGGGVAWVPPGRYRLDARTLHLHGGVRLQGAGIDPRNDPSIGSVLIYDGTGTAILAQNVKNAGVEDLLLDARGAGSELIGIHLNGAWLSTLRNVRILAPAGHPNVYGILVDTNEGVYGAQHLYMERIEVPDSTVRLAGTGGNDQVMVTVLNVVRGMRYEIEFASSITLLDTTAEAFSDTGFYLRNTDQVLMLGVDIEGRGDVGIRFGPAVHSFAGIGVNYAGYTGPARLTGSPLSGMLVARNEPTRFWGPIGNLAITAPTGYGRPAARHLEIGAANPDAVDRGAIYGFRWEVEGNGAGQRLVLRGRVHDGEAVELLSVDRDGLHAGFPDGSPGADAGTVRPRSPGIGQSFFDTGLGLPLWWDGRRWVDARGRAV